MFIKKYLVSHFIITFLVIVSLAVIGDYYFLERAMYVYSLIAVAFLFPISVAVALIIVKKGLSSLKEVAEEVANRDPNYLDPMDINHVPEEIKPLVKEINLLLSRLKQGFEREKRFAADAAHELRTPLAALKTQAQVALQATDPEVQKLALEKVIEGVNRSTHLVQQLLTLSRLLMQAETTCDFVNVPLHRIVVEVLADMAPRAIEKQLDIEFLPEKENICMKGNAKALEALLFNLVDNAIRYTPEAGGNVVVILKEAGDKVILIIRDSGPGIPDEYRNRVFEWFFRVTGNSVHGSGLGFAIIEQVVKLHHAEVKIFTPASGKGLEVNILFPAH